MQIQDTQTPLFPELLYATFAHLEHDRSSLSSCSLVARSWRTPARAELFRIVLIRPHRLPGFLEVVQQSADISRAVRTFIIWDTPPPGGLLRVPLTRSPAAVELSQLYSLLLRIRGLRELKLVNVRIVGRIAEYRGTLGDIQSIEARIETTKDRIPSFTDVVALFKNVNCVDLGFMKLPEEALPTAPSPPYAGTTTRVQKLVIFAQHELYGDIPAYIQAYRLLRQTTSVEDVAIWFPLKSAELRAADMAELLEETRSHLVKARFRVDALESLQLGFSNWGRFCDTLDFSACSRLQDVEFWMTMRCTAGVPEDPYTQRTFDAAATILGAMPSSVGKISISITTFDSFYARIPDSVTRALLESLDWTLLRHALRRLRWPRDVDFTILDENLKLMDIRDFLSQKLPEVFKKCEVTSTKNLSARIDDDSLS